MKLPQPLFSPFRPAREELSPQEAVARRGGRTARPQMAKVWLSECLMYNSCRPLLAGVAGNLASASHLLLLLVLLLVLVLTIVVIRGCYDLVNAFARPKAARVLGRRINHAMSTGRCRQWGRELRNYEATHAEDSHPAHGLVAHLKCSSCCWRAGMLHDGWGELEGKWQHWRCVRNKRLERPPDTR